MRWVNSELAWEAKALALEAAQGALDAGRLCCEATCMVRSEIAFEVGNSGHRWAAGFCGPHAVEFAADPPRDLPIGPIRLLSTDEVLPGPAVEPGEEVS